MPVTIDEFKHAFRSVIGSTVTADPAVEKAQRRAARAPVALRATVASGWAAARAGIRRFGNAILSDDELATREEFAKKLHILDTLIPDEGRLLKLVDAYEASTRETRASTRRACRMEAAALLEHITQDVRLQTLESNQLLSAGVVPPLEDALTAITTALG